MLSEAQQKRQEEIKNKAASFWKQVELDNCLQCRVCKKDLSLENFKICRKLSKQREYTLYDTECKKCRSLRYFNDRNFIRVSLENVLEDRLNATRARAKKKNLEINIDLDWLLKQWNVQDGKCFYSGRDLSLRINDINKVSIDRIDSLKGYTKNNIVLCCNIINYMKVQLSVDEFKTIINDVYNNLIKET